jgi:biopolymer transport protein ExbD
VKLRQSSNRSDPEVNITPLIDVVFLLLIFFMITTTFMRESELELSLPQASGEVAERQDRPFELVIDARGKYLIDDREVKDEGIESLKLEISQSRKGREHLPFVIRADGRAPHQAVVTAMDAAGQLDIKRIAFATLTDSGELQELPESN